MNQLHNLSRGTTNCSLAIAGVLVLWAVRSVVAGLTTAVLDAGGQRATAANYTMVGSVGGVGGLSSASADTAKHGYIGQLYEATNLAITASPASINECSNAQLNAAATLDDATVLVLAGSNIVWSAPTWPIASISPGGIATAMSVYSNTFGIVTGRYLGVSGSCVILVLDSDPDNYGNYAGDGIPDWWQVRYFGTNNPQGVASAINRTGQSNLYTYTADLDPTNPGSVFQIVAISNQPPNQVVCFRTTSAGRVYRLLYVTDLSSKAWTNLPGATWTPGQASQMSLCDTNTATARFYRVQVQVP